MSDAKGRRPPARVLTNVAANAAGQTVAALASVICVPIYLRLLGAEAIGLIGFSLGLQALIKVLDMGLSSAVVRQMARFGTDRERHGQLASFYGTFEKLFAGAAAIIAIVSLALAGPVATRWLHYEHLPPNQVMFALAAIGGQSALIFIGSLYHGALMGLERQVLFNTMRVTETVVSQLGAILLLLLWRPRVDVLFGWQLLVSVVALFVYAGATRRALPSRDTGGFRFEHVRSVWTFAAGMAGITATGTVLVNMDKVLLGRWLKLDSFGHYTLAFYAASLVGGLLVAPVFNALFPRTTAIVEQGDAEGERRTYHLTIQALVAVVWPVAAILWVFAPQALELWIHDAGAVAAAQTVLPLLVLGVALNTLMVPAYMLQLAHAWTSLGFKLNLALIAVFGPLLYVTTLRWGIRGAALNFALMQGTYLLVGLPLTHRRLLAGALREVVLRDMLPGLAICAGGAALLTTLYGGIAALAPVARYGVIFAAWLSVLALTALVSPRLRPALVRMATGRAGLGTLVT